jgi:DNA-directed RNA polymerase II subunit RPB1
MSSDQVYDDTYSQIESIDYDIWGNKQIGTSSVLGPSGGIEIPDLLESGTAKIGGLVDPRLGPYSHDVYCPTCGLDLSDCLGHFGHIDLAEYTYNFNCLTFIQKILTCVCYRCAKLLMYKNEDKLKAISKIKSGKDKMIYLRNETKNISYCQHTNYGCGVQIPKIKIDIKKSSSAVNIIAEIESDGKEEGEMKKKQRRILPPEAVHDILRNISNEDCCLFGMNPERSRPEDMIHIKFPVPPVNMRPSAKIGDLSGGSSMEDDLTHKLADIVKANMRIIKNKENQGENSGKYSAEHAHLLYYHVYTYIDNDSAALLKSEQKGKPFKSLSSRLKAKHGRVRGNLMGKRGDFTARTVITSDPTISINQLGVPVKVAMNLTFPETVTPKNIEYLTGLVKNGRDVYPGANFVFPANPHIPGKKTKQIDLRYRSEGVELHYGDIVERHLVDDDIVLLNRQPTLHKQSMMGHRIKVINDPDLLTYRLSVAVTTPYNADFDGKPPFQCGKYKKNYFFTAINRGD